MLAQQQQKKRVGGLPVFTAFVHVTSMISCHRVGQLTWSGRGVCTNYSHSEIREEGAGFGLRQLSAFSGETWGDVRWESGRASKSTQTEMMVRKKGLSHQEPNLGKKE